MYDYYIERYDEKLNKIKYFLIPYNSFPSFYNSTVYDRLYVYIS